VEIEITDNSAEVLEAMEANKLKALEQCGLAGENFAKLLCPVDTGNLRNSITHTVQDDAAYIGSNSEYAAYVELGTGKYYSGGRQTPWVYQDAKGEWHLTYGQRAQAYLKPAVSDNADTYRSIIEDALKNG
jgi:phage gpG-like protein